MAEDSRTEEKDKPLQSPTPKDSPYPRLTGGLVLILLGVLFLLSEMDRISWVDWWAYFLVGLGGIFILEFFISSFATARGPTRTGKLIAGLVLIIIGGAHLVGFEEWWPFILIAAGVALILSPLIRKK